MKPLLSITLAVVTLLAFGPAAQAQLTLGPVLPLDSSATDGILDEVGLVAFDVALDDSDPLDNVLTATLTGDLNFTPNEGDPDTRYSVFGSFDVSVGAIPVDLFDIALVADGKLVNGGGTLDAPFSDLQIIIGLTEVGQNDPIVGASIGTQIVGNGFEFVQGTDGAPAYVLAAGQSYRFGLGMLLIVDTSDLFLDPTSVVSHEFGGITAFDGYRLEVHAKPVPEPAALALLAVGALALVARRRCRSENRLPRLGTMSSPTSR